MSNVLYTLKQLKNMNKGEVWNNRILIYDTYDEYDIYGNEKKYQIFCTWDDSGD